jgi:hypothetical protein
MTGRAAGFCAGNDEAGWTTARGAFGRGFGRGAGIGGAFGRRRGGFGRGLGAGLGARRRYGYGAYDEPYEAVAPENRRRMLRSEMEALEERMEFLRREIDAMDSGRESGDE